MKKFKCREIKGLAQAHVVSKCSQGLSPGFSAAGVQALSLHSLRRCGVLESGRCTHPWTSEARFASGMHSSELVCFLFLAFLPQILERLLNLREPQFAHVLDGRAALCGLPGPAGSPPFCELRIYAATRSLLASVPPRVAWLWILFFFRRPSSYDERAPLQPRRTQRPPSGQWMYVWRRMLQGVELEFPKTWGSVTLYFTLFYVS